MLLLSALWLPMVLLRVLTVAAGLVAVPLMLASGNRPAWLWRPWFNPEDGMHGAAWWPRYLEANGHRLSRRFPSFWWSAVRNPANGLRSYPFVTVSIKPGRVRSIGNGLPTDPARLRSISRRLGWFFAWHGAYSGLWVCIVWSFEKHAKLRLGWKILPGDAGGVTEEWRADSAGFAMSVLPWRRG